MITHPPMERPLPDPLIGLDRLARNLYWSWHPSALDLFRDLDPDLWRERAGPVEIVRRTPNLETKASDPEFVDRLRAELEAFGAYRAAPAVDGKRIAYFCAEFGLHERFPMYSGGLGILAGDHLKEASDLRLPLVAVGLFYRRGFFRQLIDHEGRQEHLYPSFDPNYSPVERAYVDETPLTVEIPFPGRKVQAAVWCAWVGRVPLLMLDTDLDANDPADRPITSQLYTRGRDTRLHQEIVLGVGGIKALRALQISADTYHLNEGHSAFLLLERYREMTADGLTPKEATARVKQSSILTIHTPVPAGNERFDPDHVVETLRPLLEEAKLNPKEFLKLGLDFDAEESVFDLTAFAIRLTRLQNGVSQLHGETADGTWNEVAGQKLIGVTNGVHMPTWLGPEMRGLFERFGAHFQPTGMDLDQSDFTRARELSLPELWEAHQIQKQRLCDFARQRLAQQSARHGAGPSEIREILDAMNPEAFWIGFARRFATYKRAALLFRSEKRLLKLLDSADRPIQILFAGKAHPADRAGQALIQQVYEQTQKPRFKGKVFLIEDYDMEAGRHLVQGVDVWLNNPRRPLEASGTSGMKAAANGVPNLSILDGWWDEAYRAEPARQNGWAIGDRTPSEDEKKQDRADADALLKLLQKEVLPTYFSRNDHGIPEDWCRIMRNSIASSLYQFSTKRMLEDYLKHMI